MKKEKRFSVGDRVCYRWTDNELRKGVISSISKDGEVTMAPIPAHRFVTEWIAHVSWLKRLVPTKRPEWKGGWNKAGQVDPETIVFIPDQGTNLRPLVKLCIGTTLCEVKRK